ncbi:19274_t:CDS:2, partial [Cetraspora pellucida]
KRRSPFGMKLRERKKQVHYDENQVSDFSDSSDYLEPKRVKEKSEDAELMNGMEDEEEEKSADNIDEIENELKLSDSPEETIKNSTIDLNIQTESTSNSITNDNLLETQTKTTTTNNYDDGKKFVSSLASWIEIVLGGFISNEESLAFYDIIDITPGSNSDFVQSLPNDAVQEIKQSKMFPTPNMNNVDEMKNYIIDLLRYHLIVYEMSILFCGMDIFCEVMRSKLPTNEVEIGLILRSVSVFFKFKELLGKSLADQKKYIHNAYTRTSDNNAKVQLFITLTDLTPEKKKVQPVDEKKAIDLDFLLKCF